MVLYMKFKHTPAMVYYCANWNGCGPPPPIGLLMSAVRLGTQQITTWQYDNHAVFYLHSLIVSYIFTRFFSSGNSKLRKIGSIYCPLVFAYRVYWAHNCYLLMASNVIIFSVQQRPIDFVKKPKGKC